MSDKLRLNPSEYTLTIDALNSKRTELLSKGKDAAPVSELLIKVIHAYEKGGRER